MVNLFYAAVPTDSEYKCDITSILEVTRERIKGYDFNPRYMTLSRWKAKRPLDVFIFPFSKRSTPNNKDFEVAATEYRKILEDNFGEKRKNDMTNFIDILEYFSDVFCLPI